MTKSEPTRSFTAWRDAPSVVWLAATVLVTLVHPFLPHSRWLMVHLVLLGALTHAAMVWSTHFSQALLKTGPDLDRASTQRNRAWLLFVGVTLVFVGVVAERWPLAVLGGTLVSTAIVWHGCQLWRRTRASLAPRFAITVRYYVVAALWVPVGATLGVLLARGPADAVKGQLLVAHTAALVLGWIGLTVTGTLITLWPTMLRTRMDVRAERLAKQALPLFVVATIFIVGSALGGAPRLAGAGVLTWLAAAAWWGRATITPLRQRAPREFAPLSVGAALIWGVVLLAWAGGALALGQSWPDVADSHGPLTAIVAVGFAPQLLTGALSYLVPVVLGGGPGPVRAAGEQLGRGATVRLVLINAGLLLSLLPIPSVVRVIVTTLVLGALASFLPLLGLAIRASLRVKRSPAEPLTQSQRIAATEEWKSRTAYSPRQLVAGLGAIALAVVLGVLIDPSSVGLIGGSGGVGGDKVSATRHTTTVKVSAQDMKFVPSSITVSAGDELVIELTNDDPTTTHDLVLPNGVDSGRLRPGASKVITVGVVGASFQGWCSIVGHRQMGMVLDVKVEGARPTDLIAGHDIGDSTTASASPVNLHAQPGPNFAPVDPVLAAAPRGKTHRITLTTRELELEVAPGVWQRRWTFNGRAPGPTLRGKVGDRFIITLVNDGSMGHSIDFHAGALAPDQVMRTIPPGESLTYAFTASHSGIWMYHCSTMPMSAHIAAGMTGAVIIDPPSLPKVDREYVLVQSEVYLGANTKAGKADEVNADKVSAERPDAVVFNGIASQYDHFPLTAKVGERVRIWLLDAGPNRPTSFHIVGGQFDTTYAEGRWLLRKGQGDPSAGSQALGLQAAQGGFVELEFPEPGHYPFVSHIMVDAERGAHGFFHVTR